MILSRDGNAWIRDDRVRDRALPLYQGLMFYGRLPNVAQHIRGSGRRAKWRKRIDAFAPIQPQFLIAESTYRTHGLSTLGPTRIAIRSLARATDNRTIVAGAIPDLPAGHSVNFMTPDQRQLRQPFFVLLSSLVFDWQARMRIAGTNMTYNFLEEMGVPMPSVFPSASIYSVLGLAITPQAPTRLEWQAGTLPLCAAERLRVEAIADAAVASAFGLDADDLTTILTDCDLSEPSGRANGFWRVDQDKDPELRQTVLTLVAFRDLDAKIRDSGGNRKKGIEAFLTQNHGEGWLLPEALRLADYGLGRDDRARHPQPVACRLGPRFYDWQLAQTPEESWRECHLHAHHLLGEHRYQSLLQDIERQAEGREQEDADLLRVAEPAVEHNAAKVHKGTARKLF